MRSRAAPPRHAQPSRRLRDGERSCALAPGRSSRPVTVFALGICVERPLELLAVEVRPQLLGEVELRVRRLPEQEIRESELAPGANDELGILKIGRIQVLPEALLPAPL